VDHLAYQTNHRTGEMAALAAQFAGQMALRLVHDHLLRLDVGRYSNVLTKAVMRAYRRVQQLTKVGLASAYETRTLFFICFYVFLISPPLLCPVVGAAEGRGRQLAEPRTRLLPARRQGTQHRHPEHRPDRRGSRSHPQRPAHDRKTSTASRGLNG